MAGILGGAGYVIDEFGWLPIIVAFTLRHVSGIVIVLQSFYWIFMCPSCMSVYRINFNLIVPINLAGAFNQICWEHDVMI